MHVTPIVNKGLSFDLNYYQELKTSHSGTIFWYVDNSKLLRTKLAPFLPRMEYDAGTATVTASIVENGQELLSTSEPATPSLNNVPTSELQKLEALINELLVEASKNDTPDNVKQLVSAFPLPKPNSMPECYRLYGKGPNKKLAIVWGLARKDADGKEDVSSVVALKDFTYGLEYTPKKSYTWLWILLGIAAAGIAIYCTNGSEGSTTNSNTPTDTPPITAPPEPDEEIPVVVLTPEEQALSVPQQIEVLNNKENTVSEEIAQIEAKQTELKEKLATLDQQSAEAEAARSELDSLLARHADLKKKLDAIKTTRKAIEKAPTGNTVETPTVVPAGDTKETPTVVPAGDADETPTVVPAGDADETPTVVPAGDTKETPTVVPAGDADETPTVVPAGDTEETPTVVPAGDTEETPTVVPAGDTDETPTVVPAGDADETPTVVPSGDTEETPTVVPAGDAEETPTVVPAGDTEETPTVVPAGDADETPTVVPAGDADETPTVGPADDSTDDILTPEEKNLPAEEQLAILDKKEQAVRTEVKKLETEQKTLQSEIDSILAKQVQNTADVQLLKTLVEEYETLAEKLGSEDISDEERNQLMQQKSALDEQIEAAEQRLGTKAYSIKKERLSDIDEQLTELKKKSAQIDTARKALQSPGTPTAPTVQAPDTETPEIPEVVVQKVVNVVINQSTDYKVTYVSNTPITGTDKVLVKLNVTPLKSGLKFSKVTVADKEVDANGDVELEIQDSGTQELQLKIWVNNNAEPKYSAPIPVSTSVTE